VVSGKPPFDAENAMGLLTQHMYTQPTPLTDLESPPQSIPVQIDAIALKCLSKRPENRYATMRELIEDLERFEHGKHPVAFADLLARKEDETLTTVRAAVESASRRGRRRRSPLAILGAVLVLGSAAIVLSRAPLSGVGVSGFGPAAADETDDPEGSPVALVFSPIDAEVFHDGESLGGMPVNITVPHGEVVEVTIKREGFRNQIVRLDGSQSVVVIRLEAIAGVVPVIPVPDDTPLELFKQKLGYEEAVAAMLARPDAGTARRTARAPDAGARPRRGGPPPPAAATPPPAQPPAEASKPLPAPPAEGPAPPPSAAPTEGPPSTVPPGEAPAPTPEPLSGDAPRGTSLAAPEPLGENGENGVTEP
jgi:hypothetical protein